ncbi:histidine kinase [Chitinophaga silvatica]|uniref:histidine kinase n=1 Tax=Chitinophaga silvatica TaxID=2282649 RepID=A0A3E1YH16_9BACT|nr:sensor histidine kinase [Chitinophaga silvatica]RFS26676.1 histidine kinase [Chitinophaga silvatica]
MNSTLVFRYFICTIMILMLFERNSAQSIYFRHYEVENGLSNNSVITSLQDKKGFMWFGTPDGLNRFDGYNFRIFRINEDSSNTMSNNPIYHIYEDVNGTLWVGTLKGLFYLDNNDGTFKRLPKTKGQLVRVIHADDHNNIWFVEGTILHKYNTESQQISSYYKPTLQNITTLYKSTDGTLWLGCADGILAKYNADNNNFTFYSSPIVARIANTIETICEDKENECLLIGTSQTGLLQFDLLEKQWMTINLPAARHQQIFVRSLLKVNNSEFWIGTESGLYILNTQTKNIQHIYKINHDQYSLTDNAIYSICKDREGGIWLGTFFGGINYYANHPIYFEKFFPTSSNLSLEGNVVREIVQDKYGKLWIGSEDKGIAVFDPVKRTFINYNSENKNTSGLPNNIHGLLADNDNLYIGTFKDGLYVFDLKTHKIKQHYLAFTNNGLNSNYINIFCKTASGEILVCTSNGIYNFDKKTGQFQYLQDLIKDEFYSAIIQDSKNRIWLGTLSNGIFYIDEGHRIKKLSASLEGNDPFDKTKILNFQEDSDHHLLVCTEAGLYNLDPSTNTVGVYNTANGLPSNIVYCTVTDDQNNIWASTSMGLAYIDRKTEQIKSFKQSDGLLSDQFNHRSSFRDSDGNIYFGCLKGLIRFNPESYKTTNYIPPIYISQLQVFNKNININSRHLPFDYLFLKENKIQLPYNNSTFSLDFVALTYTAPDNVKYAYMLEGIDKNWNYIDKNKIIHFNNLSPGHYTIKIKSTNSDGLWITNDTAFGIEITPPFWKTNLAYLIYTLITLATLYMITRYYHDRYTEKQQRLMEIFTLNKEKELYQSKIDFFTKVAHEIKTPLTLIKMPMSKIIKNVEALPDLKHEIMVMNKNTDRLLTLTKQLLDFRVVESGNYSLHLSAQNIIPLIEEVSNNFQPAINIKKISFKLEYKTPVIICNIDEDGMIKIISNLIDNAIKYCDSQITISIESALAGELALIKVLNDGEIIPEIERSGIFEPFHRAGNTITSGAGIGLSLARSVTLLHQGSLEYSTDSELNIFTLTLPQLKDYDSI